MFRKKIKIIYTGGTITGVEKLNIETIDNRFESKVLIKSKPEVFLNYLTKNKELLEDFPHLEEKIDLSYCVSVNKFSEEMSPDDRVKIAGDVFKAINEGNDGIIVIHGTDTLANTSAAISFIVRGINIPVILTGSNHPFVSSGTDAIRNFSDALFVATNPETYDNFKGVFVIFSGRKDELSTIHLGTRVRKIKFFDNNFKSWNCSPIGVIGKKMNGERYVKFLNKPLLDQVRSKNERVKKKLLDKIDTNIGAYTISEFFDLVDIENAILNKKIFGIILGLYNSGTGPTEPPYSLLKPLSLARKNHIAVFAATPHEGKVEMNRYESSIKMKAEGVVPLKDMEFTVALWKLAVAGGQTEEYRIKPEIRCKKIKEIMLENIAGEIES
jgi:L-asparaginase/Glu-tRNA(Gln) amidotransferase subunit D